jgi:hypothetical protein
MAGWRAASTSSCPGTGRHRKTAERQATAGRVRNLRLPFTIDANRSLTFTLHEVYLALAKTPIEGPAGVEASFEFRAAFNATATRMMNAVLKNQQAGTEYA